MRILVLTHEFPPVGGGGGRAAEDICRGLIEQGQEVTVLTAHLEGLSRQENRDGIRIIRIPSLRRQAFRASLLAMTAYILVGLWTGSRLISRWHPDLIHVHFAVPAGALAMMLSRLTGVPYVLTIHLGDVPGGVPEKTGAWFRWIYPFTGRIWGGARRVVAVSTYTRQLALQHYQVDIRVIPNGVDLKKLHAGSLRINRPPRIVFAGRFMPQKNPLQVVRTLSELKDLAWECTMLGDGPLLGEVKQEAKIYGLKERFVFTGWVTPEEVLTQFAYSDLLFMPSLSEGLPVVGVQALAMGLAIVASRVGGFVDLVADGRNGFLVQSDDESRFSTVMRVLLSDTRRLSAFRKASLQMAVGFDIHKVTQQYEKLFREVANAQ
jgi:glycosyltransferase involved in cell wall biosynthesis